MTYRRWRMRTWIRSVLAAVAAVALIAGGCARADDGRVRLTVPACDEGACALEYEFNGRHYATASTALTDEDVAEVELERFEVAEPESFDELVTTDDPDLIYIRTDEGWVEGRT